MADPISAEPSSQGITVEQRRRWLGLPVCLPIEGTLNDVLKSLPRFGRQPFVMPSLTDDEMGVNPFLDMVYKLPSRQGENCIPIGVVSKNYRLIDHHHLLRTVEEAFTQNALNIADVRVQGEWTVNGERARFAFLLPPEERFRIRIAPGDDMGFRIELFNSVEGSCRLMAVAVWFRAVCSNGLILGTALMQLHQQHRQQLQIGELGRLLREAIQATRADKDMLQNWLSNTLDQEAFRCWIDEDVRKLWGLKAAVRIWGISREGHDVRPVGDLKDRRPTEVRTRRLDSVPGISAPVKHMFGVGQVLSWVAGQRAEISEDLEWRSQIPDLMARLSELNNKSLRQSGASRN